MKQGDIVVHKENKFNGKGHVDMVYDGFQTKIPKAVVTVDEYGKQVQHMYEQKDLRVVE